MSQPIHRDPDAARIVAGPKARPRRASAVRESEALGGVVRRRIAGRPRTAFVLSGGASLGALQVGMLRALYERGIVPDLLVGTSVGALNAAFVASRPQIPATASELARVWHRLRRGDVFPVSARALIGGAAGQRDHLFPDWGLRRLLRRHLQLERLEEAQIALHVGAFDVLGGEEVRLSDGPAIEAVLASAAIPGVLPPVSFRRAAAGRRRSRQPRADLDAVELGAERIYVLPTIRRDSRALSPARPGALDFFVHGLTVLVGARLEADLDRYGAEVELIVLPAPNSHDVQPTDFGHSGRLIHEALTSARSALSPVAGRSGAAA